MFDLRYHVASLAAVFLALIIGIVVGVGLSDRGLVGKAEKHLLEDRVTKLEGQLERVSRQSAARAREQKLSQSYIEQTYPALMRNRLRGKHIAVIFVGSVDPRLRSSIDQALSDAGAPGTVRLRALKLPIDVRGIDAALASQPAFTRYVGDKKLQALGAALAQEFVAGGETPLWDRLADQLIEERTGGKQRAADGVIVARSVPPQKDGTARFLNGLYSVLGSADTPAVGVEPSETSTSAVETYRRKGISSVDDIDKPAGRLALALLLAGARPGHYGLKPGADGGMVPPLTRPPLRGG